MIRRRGPQTPRGVIGLKPFYADLRYNMATDFNGQSRTRERETSLV
jgi:hypothetical protein